MKKYAVLTSSVVRGDALSTDHVEFKRCKNGMLGFNDIVKSLGCIFTEDLPADTILQGHHISTNGTR